MCVIISKNYMNRVNMGENLRQANRCTACGSHLAYPFVWWRDDPERFVCSGCCKSIKSDLSARVDRLNSELPERGLANDEHYRIAPTGGFYADVIVCCAIKELQRVGYPQYTLVRRSIADVDRDEVPGSD